MKILNYTHSLFLVLLLFLLSCGNASERTLEMTPEKWRDDIENLFSTLELKHINLYHSISKDKVQKEVNLLLEELPKLSNDEIFLRLSKIIKSLDDSHTGIWNQSEFYNSYPLEFFVFNDTEIRVKT